LRSSAMRGGAGAGFAPRFVCMLTALSAVVSWVIVSGAGGQAARPIEPTDRDLPTKSIGPVSFVLDTGLFYSPDGSPLVEIYVQVPYDQLPFVREGGGFVSRVEVVAVFENVSGNQVGGDSWSREIWVEDYDQTIDPRTTYRAQATFSLPPGEYSLRLSCGAVDSEVKGEAYRILEVPRRTDEGLILSDIRLGSCASSADTAVVLPIFPLPAVVTRGPFIPNAARSFGTETETACAKAEVYSFDDGSTDTTAATFTVSDEGGNIVWEDRESVEMTGRATEVDFYVPIDSLAWGTYGLELALSSGDDRVTALRYFEVDESRVGADMDLEGLIDLMSIVATEEELQTLAELPESERKAYLEEIWRSRDPDTSTPRNEFRILFFERLKEAKLKFEEGGVEGWRTDRGRVYIRNGPPDRIETSPGVTGSISPYATIEIWYYDGTNARYVFEDFGGNGKFTLVDVIQG